MMSPPISKANLCHCLQREFSVTNKAIFAISRKLIIWYKTIELSMVNYQIWYDLGDWFKCL